MTLSVKMSGEEKNKYIKCASQMSCRIRYHTLHTHYILTRQSLKYSKYLGPDHLELTLTQLELNKKLKENWKFQFFYLVPKHFRCPN